MTNFSKRVSSRAAAVLAVLALWGPLAAQTFTSNPGSKNWSDPAAWDPYGVPGPTDTVTVGVASVLTVDTTAATASTTTVSGTLKFSRTAPSALTLVGGNITVNSGGILDMGTALYPITAQATLFLAMGTRPGQYGLQVMNGGKFHAYGVDKGHVAVADGNALQGATSVQVPAAQSSGWQLGDLITLGQTEKTHPFIVETETRTVTSLTPSGSDMIVGWDAGQGLAYDHHSAGGLFRVGNLTRNVVVTSSGTDHAENTAGVSGATTATDFTMVNAEFNSLDGPGAGGTFLSALQASSCTFHNNGIGLQTFGSATDPSFVEYSLFAMNATYGAELGLFTVRYCEFYGNGGSGLSGGGIVRSNQFYGNGGDGLTAGISNALIVGNNVWLNGSIGLHTQGGTGTVFDSNAVWENGLGIMGYSPGGNVFWKNLSYSNYDTGHVTNAGQGLDFDIGSIGNISAGNLIYFNVGGGVLYRRSSSGNVSIGDYVYGNGGGYYLEDGSTGNVVLASQINYDPSGNTYPTGGAVGVDGGSPENFILKECRINPATSISADGFNQDGNYLISYNQDVSTGTVRIYGGYVSPGNFVVDQAQNLYEASVTTPRLLRGNGHLAAVTLDPANDGVAVTQLFMIRCTSATSHTWVVEGSSSGVLATFTGTQTHLPVPSVSPWFYLDFNEGAPAVEDRLMFVFQSSSKDAGKQKSLVFGPSAPSYNGGKSKLTVGPGKNLVLRGTAAEPTTMDRQAGISVYYTVVSSGGLTLDNATVSNVDSNGIQATGAGPVFLASSTFTNLGTDATQRTYMTLSALTSNATFYGMAFNATGGRTNSTSYGIVVQESSPNLRRYFPDAAAGGLIGDADTLQSIRRIYWSDTTPPATPTVFLAVPSATTEGEVALSWTSPGDDGMSLPILGGSFLIFDSTDAATAASAVPGQAQRVIPVVSASTGSSQAFTWDGLRPGATHYFELWAADEWVNNTSTVPASQSAWCPAMTVPALTGLTVGRTIGVALSTAATATFTKPMDLASTAGAVSWTLVKNNLGISTSAAVAFTLSSNTAGNVITIASTAPLAGNGTYVVTVTTAVKDVFGMNLSTSTTLRFTTIMDHTAHNVVTDGLSGATVDVPSNALSVDGYLAAAPAPAGAAAATQKLVANTGDAMRAPVAGGTAAIGALDSGGTPRLFSAPVTVFLAYADADGDGIVDGTSPPLQAKTLTVHWLDEARNLWVPLPTSVDLASRRASAVTPQGAAFALIGQAYTDLSETIAFPTPYRASPGDSGITFSGIGQDATIRIYTVSGRLLREIPISGGNGTYQWDVKNSDGQPVKSGMYYYRVSSGNEVKRGKLAVIR